jgi:hypothetical protein
MKHLRLLFLLLFSIVIFSSCEKEFWKKDFRDKYVGKYQVTEKLTVYGSPHCNLGPDSEKDTIIIVDYGSKKNTLFVLGREVELDEDGYYYAYHFGLRIWNDSIWSLHMNGGLGCGIYERYEGYRISSKP